MPSPGPSSRPLPEKKEPIGGFSCKNLFSLLSSRLVRICNSLSNFLSSLPLKSLLLLAQGFGGDAIVVLKFGIVMKELKLPPNGAICDRNMAFSEMDMPASVRSVQHTPLRELLLADRLSTYGGKPNGRHFKSSDGLDHTTCQWKPPRGVNIKQRLAELSTVFSILANNVESKSAEALGGNLLAQLKKRKLSQKGKPGKPSGRKAVRKANKLCKMPEKGCWPQTHVSRI